MKAETSETLCFVYRGNLHDPLSHAMELRPEDVQLMPGHAKHVADFTRGVFACRLAASCLSDVVRSRDRRSQTVRSWNLLEQPGLGPLLFPLRPASRRRIVGPRQLR